ncbi:MAG TPA: hypothetical protein VG125_25865 [Pirellulales bacterium]|nr:hypothetical protein [Pirellulales bacterium]
MGSQTAAVPRRRPKVEAVLVRELAGEQVLRMQQIKLGAGEGKRLEIPFKAQGRFGA